MQETNDIIKIYDSFFESENEAEFDSLKLQKYTYIIKNWLREEEFMKK